MGRKKREEEGDTKGNKGKKRDRKGIRRIFFSLLLLLAPFYSLFFPLTVHAEDVLNAGEKAKKIHELASSDVIYTDQEAKALYYQNVQIIDLLTQIRDLLEMRLKESKD